MIDRLEISWRGSNTSEYLPHVVRVEVKTVKTVWRSKTLEDKFQNRMDRRKFREFCGDEKLGDRWKEITRLTRISNNPKNRAARVW